MWIFWTCRTFRRIGSRHTISSMRGCTKYMIWCGATRRLTVFTTNFLPKRQLPPMLQRSPPHCRATSFLVLKTMVCIVFYESSIRLIIYIVILIESSGFTEFIKHHHPPVTVLCWVYVLPNYGGEWMDLIMQTWGPRLIWMICAIIL